MKKLFFTFTFGFLIIINLSLFFSSKECCLTLANLGNGINLASAEGNNGVPACVVATPWGACYGPVDTYFACYNSEGNVCGQEIECDYLGSRYDFITCTQFCCNY